MNERTHFFIKVYLSHFILERVDVGCVWEMSWSRGQIAILTQEYVFLILAGLLNPGSLRAQSPLFATGSQFGNLSPTDCFSKYANSQPIASGHEVIHTPVSVVYYDNCNCQILCARVLTIPDVCVPELRAE